jgi:hypothetical protein
VVGATRHKNVVMGAFMTNTAKEPHAGPWVAAGWGSTDG